MAKDDAGAREPSPKPVRVPVHLSKAARVWAVIFGAAALGAGAASVFIVDHDWGPVALLVIGALFVLSGLVGRLPYLKWSGGELDYGIPAEEVVRLIKIAPDERAKAFEDLAKVVPPSFAPVVLNLANEAELMEVVRAARPRRVAISDGIGSEPLRSDGVLIDSTGRKLVVEIKTGRIGGQVERLRRTITEFKLADTQIVGGLLIHTRPISEGAKSALQEGGWEPVLVGDADDPGAVDAVREAIEKAFASGPSHGNA